jgi:hypothetical protein
LPVFGKWQPPLFHSFNLVMTQIVVEEAIWGFG